MINARLQTKRGNMLLNSSNSGDRSSTRLRLSKSVAFAFISVVVLTIAQRSITQADEPIMSGSIGLDFTRIVDSHGNTIGYVYNGGVANSPSMQTSPLRWTRASPLQG